MPVRFDKVADRPPLGDFDGFDAEGGYQMVPVFQERFIDVVTGAESCVLKSTNSAIARMQRFTSSRPLPSAALIDRAVLPPNARVSFSIFGASVGRCQLLLESGGTVRDELTISVKSKRTVTVSLCMLVDIRRSSSFFPADVMMIMRRVGRTYLQQANVEFTIRGGLPSEVNVPRDLGNPLRPAKSEIFNAILDATSLDQLAADQVVYCCWNVETKEPVIGLNMGKYSFVEDNGQGSASQTVNATFAHELGHALGLDHVNDPNCIMSAVADPRSSRFRQFEIDTLNPSGVN